MFLIGVVNGRYQTFRAANSFSPFLLLAPNDCGLVAYKKLTDGDTRISRENSVQLTSDVESQRHLCGSSVYDNKKN